MAKMSSIQRVQRALEDQGLDCQIRELPESTRTAQEAAEAVGCQLGQIVKSLVFSTITDRQPILVMTSGTNRVDEAKLEDNVGEEIQFASPDFVREKTGFAIGGVAPFGHQGEITTYIDQDLLDYSEIWAAAGSPRAVFRLTPGQLLSSTGGKVIQVSSGPRSS